MKLRNETGRNKPQAESPEESPVVRRVSFIEHILGVAELGLTGSKDDEVRDEALEVKRLLKARKSELESRAA